jgi:hypothetical protein
MLAYSTMADSTFRTTGVAFGGVIFFFMLDRAPIIKKAASNVTNTQQAQ